jgi:uncharacterized protein (TIGR03083 family)
VDENDVAASVAAWRQSLAAIVEICAGLRAAGWDAQTECPEWTVKDVCAHLVGGELWMSEGHPAPADGLATIADRPVAARRARTGAEVHAELRDVFTLRQEQLAADPPDPRLPATTAYGIPVTVGILLTHRAFDVWVHEQDIRRAVGVPGNLDTPAARMSSEILLAGLGRVVAKLASAPRGSVVRFTVDGPVSFDRAVTVDGNGRGQLAPWAGGAEAGPVTTHLRMGWETYARLAAGRIPAAAAAVEVTGDEAVAGRVLARFAVTP